MNDGWVKLIDEERDLGALISKDLKFSRQCLMATNKANVSSWGKKRRDLKPQSYTKHLRERESKRDAGKLLNNESCMLGKELQQNKGWKWEVGTEGG